MYDKKGKHKEWREN